MKIPDWYLNRMPCPSCGEEHPKCGDHVGSREMKRPCRGSVAAGQWRCSRHRSAKEAEEQVDIEEIVRTHAPIGQLMRKCGVTVRNRTYVESLEDALHRANVNVMLLGMLIETLAPTAEFDEIVEAEGTPKETTRFIQRKAGLVGPDHEGDLATHPYMIMYQDWVKTQGQLSKLAADLGLIERQVEVQEAQVKVMAVTLSAILADLEIDLSDPRVRSIIETHLLRMEQTSIEIAGSLTATATAS